MEKHDGTFRISKALYAVRLDSLTLVRTFPRDTDTLFYYEIPAVWYRRRRGVDTANIGYLWSHSRAVYRTSPMYSEEELVQDADIFLRETLTDGRFGPRCTARFDGAHLWCTAEVDFRHQFAYFYKLKAMLDAMPAIPQGYDGWWRF